MNKLLFLTPAIALSVLSLNNAHAQTIADWTFETSQPATAGPFSPEVGSGSALGFHSGVIGATAYSSPAGNGVGSLHSFSSSAWNVGDYDQFSVSTIGFQNITVSFDQTSSNTGPRDFNLEYSLNGTSFTSFASYSVPANAAPNAWNTAVFVSAAHFSYDLSSLIALNNASTVYFQLVDADTTSAAGGTVASGGTDRVDNFTVATVVPEPSTLALAGLGGLTSLLAFRRRK